MKITALLDALNSALAEPFALAWSQDSPRFLLVFTVIYAVVLIVAVSDQKNTRPGAEHGSAAWGDVFRLNKFYMDKRGPNLLLTQHFYIGIDGYKHKHNTNILIVGGSGAGKTRTYGVPNVLECACSMVITDPKAEILRKTGNLLKQKGYEVIVFDLINPAASFCYNPFVYVHDDREVLTLIENLIQNTTPSHSKSSDPFWEKSETALLQALMLYLLHEAPPEEQNFSMVMEMISAAEVHEDDDNYQSPLDILFERLEMREPDSIACKQYRIFKQAAGKTAKSILVSVGVRLAAFNLPSIAKLTMADEMHLQELGERKIALFCCIPDSDKSLNYLVGMIYTQLIQTLYRQADRVHKGRLPVPVHCLMDEYANISLPKDTFLSALATTLLEEVLPLFAGRAPLVVELKTDRHGAAALARDTVDCLDRFSIDYCVESFDPRPLRWLRRHRPSVLRGQLSQDFHRHPSGQGPWNRLALTNLFYNAFTRPDFVAYRFGDREKPAVRLCRKFGMRMAYWTLRSRADVALAEQEGALPIFEEPDRPKEVTH